MFSSLGRTLIRIGSFGLDSRTVMHVSLHQVKKSVYCECEQLYT
jgi:hypothetical protein